MSKPYILKTESTGSLKPSHKKVPSRSMFETIEQYDPHFFESGQQKEIVLTNNKVQKRVFLPFTNERDHLGRLQLKVEDAVKLAEPSSPKRYVHYKSNPYTYEKHLKKKQREAEEVGLVPHKNKRTLEKLLQASPKFAVSEENSKDESISTKRTKNSAQILPLISVMYETPMANKIDQNVFELTEMCKSPQYYEITAKGRLSASEMQLEYDKINSGQISILSNYVPPKEKKSERDHTNSLRLNQLASANFEEIFSEKRGWRKEDIIMKASLRMKQKEEERELIRQGVTKRAPLKLRNPLKERLQIGSSFGLHEADAEKTLRIRQPNCLILPEHKPSPKLNLPKLDLNTQMPNSDYGFKKSNLTNRLARDEYHWMFHGANKQPSEDPVDHWKLSIKPLKDFESFPDEWLGEMKTLKMRVGLLRQNIHSVPKRHLNDSN